MALEKSSRWKDIRCSGYTADVAISRDWPITAIVAASGRTPMTQQTDDPGSVFRVHSDESVFTEADEAYEMSSIRLHFEVQCSVM